ncbi:hypothetical protein KZO01_24450 [Kurthia zopfii]|uniref:YfhD family protein n=1 Tax=Kurthia zopfii TaxID=1650 RepID=A0A2U3A9P8_9BACL|nr:hypothetical protein [Kurthia zopfii]PWI21171.1 hypothetical protein DF281_13560 [Kurthia zopfii]TDR33406.1 hypothetical protein DFR61_1549 [Kurthia zopfii]STX08839.1 Uncharacterised protein [Kurthia zopfii]VEI04949.1 Uncharacterised protein [Kurthia zopfii]GEK32136.1 hypothetical protein KZO01_24450 [Kurthia zopfii]
MAKESERNTRKKNTRKNLEKPDMVNSDNPSLFDMHEDMQTVDPIPVEELNEKVKDEKNKEHTKDSSASDTKYNP